MALPLDPASAAAPDGLVVFDGACALCTMSVRLVLRFDRGGTIRLTPIRSKYGELLCARHGIDPDDPDTFLFFDRGRPLAASDGVLAVIDRLPRAWRWLRVLRLVPRPLRDAAYRLVARNRYRLFGRRQSCASLDPAQRTRFVTAIPAAEASLLDRTG